MEERRGGLLLRTVNPVLITGWFNPKKDSTPRFDLWEHWKVRAADCSLIMVVQTIFSRRVPVGQKKGGLKKKRNGSFIRDLCS